MNAFFAPPASDHIAVICQLDIPKPAIQPVTTQFRSISNIYRNSFKQNIAQSTTSLTSTTETPPSLPPHRLSAEADPLVQQHCWAVLQTEKGRSQGSAC